MDVRNEIIKYSGIIIEDNAKAYAQSLYNEVISKTLSQSKLSNVSYINFNNERINKSNIAKDNILNYKTENDFVNDVLNWFKNKNYFSSENANFIIKSATDYYNKFKSK